MPPTVQSGGEADRDKRPQRSVERRNDILCRVKYSNTLPDIPSDLKFIIYPFETTRFIQYNPTSLERNYRYEVLTEHDLGVNIDLINREIYQGDGYAQLDPADEKLLEEDVLTPQDSKRSRHHAKSVSWLRRSEYISTEQTRFQPQTMEKVEAKVGYNVKKSFREETLFMDRDSQMKAIEKTFTDNKIPIDKHYSKPGVTAVEVMPVFPDFDLWKYPCAQVIFDTDPAPADKNISAQIEQMSQAMIRGVMDESGEQFVAYFLPTDETLQQRRKDLTEEIPYTDGDSYEYKMAREYNWNVKSKASKGYEENYFLVVRQGCVYYNELETRVRLSKRRARGPTASGTTRLIVSHRPLGAREHRMLRLREKQLEPPQDEDEDEEEEEEEDDQREEEQQEQPRSRSKSGSPVPSRNGKSPAGSRAGSAERSRSGSRASSRARSRQSRSRSKLRHSGSEKSRSASPAGSGSPKSHRSRSGSRSQRSESGSQRSGSGSPRSRSRSGSRRSKSGSPARSGSASPARSGSGSPARSGSGSPARSGSGSARSGSGSPARSGSGSPARSGSRSARSASGSPARSGSGSPARSGSGRSRSGSRASSRSGSASNAGSRASSRRNSGSRSGSRQGSGSGSGSE